MSDSGGQIRAMTDGSFVVTVELMFNVNGKKVVVTDHSEQDIGDACSALHFAALRAIGGKIVEARNTDAFSRQPRDPGKLAAKVDRVQVKTDAKE
jgi:hypothetical protein